MRHGGILDDGDGMLLELLYDQVTNIVLDMMGAEIPFTEREPEGLTYQHPK